jgi:hypothetical protein
LSYSLYTLSLNEFPTETYRNGLKQGNALSPFLFSIALEYALRRV